MVHTNESHVQFILPVRNIKFYDNSFCLTLAVILIGESTF